MEEARKTVHDLAKTDCAVIYLTETLIFIFAKRRTATVLQSPRQFFCLPLFRFAKPFINGLLNWHSQQGDNYTWE